MIKKTVIFYVFLFIPLVFMVSVSGCGVPATTSQTTVEIIDDPAIERLHQFDNQLAAISDESTAKTAVTTFADYVEGYSDNSGSKASSIRIFSESLISHIAQKEVKARKQAIGALDTGSQDDAITIDKITETLNLVKDPSVREIRNDDVEYIQCAIRSELPDIAVRVPNEELSSQSSEYDDPILNTRPSSTITPIEAMVIGYAFATGDRGESGAGAFADKLPVDRVNIFLDKVIE